VLSAEKIKSIGLSLPPTLESLERDIQLLSQTIND
jgi:hypothetical protein